MDNYPSATASSSVWASRPSRMKTNSKCGRSSRGVTRNFPSPNQPTQSVLQERPATGDLLPYTFSRRAGNLHCVADYLEAISANLEAQDIDRGSIYEPWCERVEEKLPGLL